LRARREGEEGRIGGRECTKACIYPDPSLHFDILADVGKGQVKAAMLALVGASNESDVTIIRKPQMKVRTKAAFEKGCFHLVAISPTVGIAVDKGGQSNVPANAIAIRSPLFEHKGEHVRGFIKSSLAFPKELSKTGCAQHTTQTFVAAFWATRQTLDPEEANCVRGSKDVTVCMDPGEKRTIEIPTLTNTKPMQEGDEVILYKKSIEDGERQAKRARIEPPKGEQGKKPKAKAKGKAAAKGK